MDAIVACSDGNYMTHAKSLFGQCKSVGRWTGDFVLITSNSCIRSKTHADFVNFGAKVVIKPKPSHSYFYKEYIFDSEFHKYRRVLYLDLDIVVQKAINLSWADDKNCIYADKEPFLIEKTMLNKAPKKLSPDQLVLIDALKIEYDLAKFSYNSGAMVICNGLLNSESKHKFQRVRKQIKLVNYHCRGVQDGGDQPIFNLAFYDSIRWHRGLSSCWPGKDKGTIFAHCIKYKPWDTSALKSAYKFGLNIFASKG